MLDVFFYKQFITFLIKIMLVIYVDTDVVLASLSFVPVRNYEGIMVLMAFRVRSIIVCVCDGHVNRVHRSYCLNLNCFCILTPWCAF